MIIRITAKPGQGERVIQHFEARLKDARAFPGCQSIALYAVYGEPDASLLVERWASAEDHEHYVAWRTGTGDVDALLPLLAKPIEFVRLIETAA